MPLFFFTPNNGDSNKMNESNKKSGIVWSSPSGSRRGRAEAGNSLYTTLFDF